MLYRVVPSFASVDEILNSNHSNESYCAVPSRGVVYYAVPGVFLPFESSNKILNCDPSTETELLRSTLLWCPLSVRVESKFQIANESQA